MNLKQKPIASAVALALSGAAFSVFAQQAAPETRETVTVTGIRASVEKSLQTKQNADTVVEVITAEDIGKLPDKNVADAVQRLPGVTISSSAGGEGGFDENDRVSLRGTSPSLTQTLINGHGVATGDWFVLDQVTLVGRSVSFTLLPSEIVSQVIVRKTATADLVEGGVAGNVDIITRKPLEFAKPFTVEASAGSVYTDLAKKWDGQFSGLVNWKNDAGNVGVMLQGFWETRHLRRDGQEILGYSQVTPGSTLAVAHPDLANAYYPTLIGSAFFEQKRERKGGLIDVQFKVNNEFTIDLSGFTSRLDADNYNRNWMFWGAHVFNNGNGFLPSTYTLSNGTITAANFPNTGTAASRAQYAIVDQILRPGSYAETNFFDVDARWRANKDLAFTFKAGQSEGKGITPKQDVFEGDVFNTGANYTMHGIGSGVDMAFPSGNPSNFAGTSLDWIFGASPAESHDKEKYGQIDGEWGMNGLANSIKFGWRYNEHERETIQVAQGPNFAGPDPFSPANLPAWNGETYPGNFGSGIGGNFPRQPWMLSPGELERWGDLYSNRDPVTRDFWSGEFKVKEKNNAAYLMANFDGAGWSGNAGVRYVQTKEIVRVNVGLPNCPVMAPCPGAPAGTITTSAFGSYYQNEITNTYNDWLPSANLRLDLGNRMIARFAAARTLARPDYSALGGSINADDTTHTGSGGNPYLKPIRSTNLDATWEWYYAPRSLVSAGLFYMDLTNYVGFGTYQTQLLNIKTGQFETYTITAPNNSKGRVNGLELAWQQPVGMGFGVQANYTYADAKEKKNCNSGDTACQNAPDALVGASKNTYNLIGYYENDKWSARLAYTYRSAFFVGLDRSTPEFQDDTGTLGASLSYNINKNFSINFDGLNLNDPTLKYYGANKDQPRAFYVNGRQYYLTLRWKL